MIMNFSKLVESKQGLFFIPNLTGYSRKDFKWLNSACSSYKDSKGKNFFMKLIK
jgi:hypothetical protein